MPKWSVSKKGSHAAVFWALPFLAAGCLPVVPENAGVKLEEGFEEDAQGRVVAKHSPKPSPSPSATPTPSPSPTPSPTPSPSVSPTPTPSPTPSPSPSPSNRAPVANAGADRSVQLPGNATLLGSGSDPDGDSISYLWTKVSGGTAVFSSSVAAQPTVSQLQAGSYVFRLQVTDSKMASSTDTVSVTVQAEPTPSPTPSPSPTGSTDANAGKVSLWTRWGPNSPQKFYYDAAVFLPKDYGSDPTKRYPMVLSLHGLGGSTMDVDHTAVGGNKEGFIKQVWNTTLGETFPAIVIGPNARAPGATAQVWWSAVQLRQLIIDAKVKYKVDPDRIVVTGLSAGGAGTLDLIKNSKDLIAAAMPGAYNEDLFTNDPCVLADLPVWAFGNSSDGTFQPNDWKTLEPKVKACANYTGEFTLTVYSNSCGHGCWDDHWKLDPVQQWLVNQSK